MRTQDPTITDDLAHQQLAAFGATVRHAYEQAGLSKRQLATAVKLDRAAVTRIEEGRRAPKFDKLLLLAQACGTTPAALLAGIGPAGRLPTGERPRETDPAKRFAANLKWVRTGVEPHYTQEELALEAEIDRSSPSGYETGRMKPPTLRTILKMSAAMGIGPSLLLEGVRPVRSPTG